MRAASPGPQQCPCNTTCLFAVANRVLCCGEGSRARAIADKYLDKDGPRFELVSHREFVIITGTFNKVRSRRDPRILVLLRFVRLSSCTGARFCHRHTDGEWLPAPTRIALSPGSPSHSQCVCQGFPNTDFVVRECRAVTSGTMAFIRFGSCGGMNETKAGTVAVADKTIGIYRNPGAWYGEDVEPYFTTPPIPGDAELTELVRARGRCAGCFSHMDAPRCQRVTRVAWQLRERMKAHVTDSEVVGGINASADMFYGSQGATQALRLASSPDCVALMLLWYCVTALQAAPRSSSTIATKACWSASKPSTQTWPSARWRQTTCASRRRRVDCVANTRSCDVLLYLCSFDLAHMSHEPMRASGAAMVVRPMTWCQGRGRADRLCVAGVVVQYANRRYKNVTSPEQAAKLVEQGGLACLEALTMLPLAPEVGLHGTRVARG